MPRLSTPLSLTLRTMTLAVMAARAPIGWCAVSQVVDVAGLGISGDGTTLNTAKIQQAIDQCSGTGGGILHFPKGRYLTGTIEIKSGVTLDFDEQATLLGSSAVADYRNVDPFIDGSNQPMGHALVVAVGAENVGITGKGTIDGQSPKLRATQKSYDMRPFLVRWVRCKNVTLRDIHLINPGAWTLNFYQAKDVTIEGITIRSRNLKMHNNDGINIDSSEHVRVRNCDVMSGDDALVIKATNASEGSRDIVATDCKLSTHTNAIKLGTESIGTMENISISNCQVSNTDMAGIALYTVDGGDIRNITVKDIAMDHVNVPISLRLGARLTSFREGDHSRSSPGNLREVVIQNVKAKNAGMIGMLINGVPGHPIEALTLENIELELPGGGTHEAAKAKLSEKEKSYPEINMFGHTLPAYGIYARHVRGVKFDKIALPLKKSDARPATAFIDVEDSTPDNFTPEAANQP